MRTSLHRRTSTLSWTHSPEVFGEAQKAGQGHVNVHAFSERGSGLFCVNICSMESRAF